ncbi:MAG: DUF5658 family protein [Candidatus Bathyarchaeota archaeon]|nr:DUF5658 family protein [Candidatus Bathyarchaeota archaeon]
MVFRTRARTASLFVPYYGLFLVTLTLFTFLDAFLTVVGLRVGLTELNPIVTQWGIQSWILFRILFVACLIAVFITGYYLCREYSPTGLRFLGVFLFLLNAFIGAVVFSSVISIYLQIHAYA